MTLYLKSRIYYSLFMAHRSWPWFPGHMTHICMLHGIQYTVYSIQYTVYTCTVLYWRIQLDEAILTMTIWYRHYYWLVEKVTDYNFVIYNELKFCVYVTMMWRVISHDFLWNNVYDIYVLHVIPFFGSFHIVRGYRNKKFHHCYTSIAWADSKY